MCDGYPAFSANICCSKIKRVDRDGPLKMKNLTCNIREFVMFMEKISKYIPKSDAPRTCSTYHWGGNVFEGALCLPPETESILKKEASGRCYNINPIALRTAKTPKSFAVLSAIGLI